MKIVFLVSGGGGHLKYLQGSIKCLNLPVQIAGVIADRPCGALNFAKENNIPAVKIHYSNNDSKSLRDELLAIQPDLIITNIHKIIDAETLSLFPGKFINLHYSLLPAFKGLIGMATLEEARKLNVGFIGATCHSVIEAVDAGSIISQACFRADWKKPNEELMEITFRSACLILLDSIIKTLHINCDSNNAGNYIIKETPVLFNPSLSFNVEKIFNCLWPIKR